MNTDHMKLTGRPEGGFTLIELAVVIAILGIAAVLVYPKLSGTGESGLRASARTLAATIRYLDDRAVTTRTGYRMKINLDDSTVGVVKLSRDGEETPLDDVFLDRRLLADGITVSDVTTSRLGKATVGEVRLEFGPQGLGEPAAIHLRSPGGNFYTVRVYPRSGRVRVFENYSGAAP